MPTSKPTLPKTQSPRGWGGGQGLWALGPAWVGGSREAGFLGLP